MADLSKRLGYEVVDLVLSDPFCWQIGQDYAFSSFWIFPRHRICYEKVSVEHMMLKPMAGWGAMEREETEEDRLFSAPSREVPRKFHLSWVKNHSKAW